jgi:hypothetical protein
LAFPVLGSTRLSLNSITIFSAGLVSL